MKISTARVIGGMRWSVTAPVEVHALLMATWVTAGMAVWMAWRRHAWPLIVEMGLAMYLAFVFPFPLLQPTRCDGMAAGGLGIDQFSLGCCGLRRR